MKKSERIALLEQRVAELMGEVERLNGDVSALQARNGWWSIEPYPKPPYVPTWAEPNAIWPFEITSVTVTTPKDKAYWTFN